MIKTILKRSWKEMRISLLDNGETVILVISGKELGLIVFKVQCFVEGRTV